MLCHLIKTLIYISNIKLNLFTIHDILYFHFNTLTSLLIMKNKCDISLFVELNFTKVDYIISFCCLVLCFCINFLTICVKKYLISHKAYKKLIEDYSIFIVSLAERLQN